MRYTSGFSQTHWISQKTLFHRKFRLTVFVDSGQFSLARNTLKHGEPGLLTIVREHETVPNGFGRLGTTV